MWFYAKMEELVEIIRKKSSPMDPSPTGVSPQLNPLGSIKAVIFDVYGTLFASGCGDISLISNQNQNPAIWESLEECDFKIKNRDCEPWAIFLKAINETKEELKHFGTDFPEVDIREIWSEVLMDLFSIEAIEGNWDAVTLAKLAVCFECRVNPIWTMPHAKKVINTIFEKKLPMGIVSNAQFFTPLLFDVFFSESYLTCGFSENICVWSYEKRMVKPSLALFKPLCKDLKNRGIATQETVFVGNDMLNDIWAANQLGLKTVLFAGDQRSLRWRKRDARCQSIAPNAVITDLRQLLEII